MDVKVSVSFLPSIFTSIITLIIGVILFTRPDLVTIAISYILGTIILIYGIFKIIYFSYQKGKDNSLSFTGCIPGIILVCLGLICIFLSGVIEQAIRFIIGAIILLVGINRVINLGNFKDKKSSRFIASLIVAIALIAIGLYVIIYSNLVLSGLGLILIISSIMEIINYILQAGYLKNPKDKIPEAEVKEKDDLKEIETTEKVKKKTNKKKDKKA